MLENSTSGRTRSALTHGHTRAGKVSRTYRIWTSMMARCFYPSCRSYKWYGAKGITVCLQWRKFAGFLKDMGEAPDGLTIDRKKNHLPYSKGNCRWATPRVQQNNRDNNHRVTFQGKRMTIAEASRATGICPFVIVARINKLKWSEEKALTTPVRKLTPRAA